MSNYLLNLLRPGNAIKRYLIGSFALALASNAFAAGYQTARVGTVAEVNSVQIINAGANLTTPGYQLFLRANAGSNGTWGNGDNVELLQWNDWTSQKWVFDRPTIPTMSSTRSKSG